MKRDKAEQAAGRFDKGTELREAQFPGLRRDSPERLVLQVHAEASFCIGEGGGEFDGLVDDFLDCRIGPGRCVGRERVLLDRLRRQCDEQISKRGGRSAGRQLEPLHDRQKLLDQ